MTIRSVIVTLLVLAAVSAASARSGTANANRQTLVFDAVILQAGQGGPRGLKPGHVDSATGILRDAAGHSAGRFSSTCVVLKTLAQNDALQRCTGSGVTSDGRLAYSGTVRASERTPTERISGGSGADRGAQGTITLYALSQTETLASVAITPRPGVTLRTGAVARPGANAAFRTHADGVCAAAARRLATVRTFPFAVFDLRRPSPQMLPKVAGYYTGSHDARPVLRALDRRLSALRQPPADRALWSRLLAYRNAVVAAEDAALRAAPAANVDAFVKAVRRGAAAERGSALSALVFGATTCVL